jgi:tetraacyldisaccharide 4'-kinase
MSGELGTPYQLIDPSNTQTMESISNTYLPKQITAVAALGNPQGFFDDLLENGVAAKYIPLPDHATYTHEFFESIHADCILITENDAVKCAAIADERIWVVPMNLSVSDDLADWLQSILQRPDPRSDPRSNPRPSDHSTAWLGGDPARSADSRASAG